MKDDKIKKAMPRRRDAASYQLLRDIVIPAGTILRDATVYRGSTPEVCAHIGIASGVEAYFSVDAEPETLASGVFKKVTAL